MELAQRQGMMVRRSRPKVGSLSLRTVGCVLAAGSVLLLADATVRHRGDVDYWLLNAIQGIDVPFLGRLLDAAASLTASSWTIVAWLGLLAAFIAARAWSMALAASLVPVGLGLNSLLISPHLVSHAHPDATRLHRLVGEPAAFGFSCGDVVAAVLVYGLLIASARRVSRPSAVSAIR